MIKYLSGLIALSVLVILISFPAYALEIPGETEIIHEFQKGYYINSIATDGKYLLISEKKPNEKFSESYFTEGYQWLGNLYLYDIASKNLAQIPGNIPVDSVTIVNSTVYWKSSVYRYPVLEDGHQNMYQTQNYYQYTPGEPAPKKLDFPCDKPISRFLTNGRQFITITGDPTTNTISLTKYLLPTGNPEIIPTLTNPDPDDILLNDNMIIYQGLEITTRNVIYVHSMNTGQTSTFEPKENEYQRVLGACGNIIIYLWNENTTPMDGKYQLRRLNAITGETASICSDPMYLYPAPKMKTMNYDTVTIGGPVIFWYGTTIESDMYHTSTQLYGYSLNGDTGVQLISDDFNGENLVTDEKFTAWVEYDEQTNRQKVYMLRAEHADLGTTPHQPTPTVPSSTTAGSPNSMAIGTVAFALACILAVLWRKNN